MKPLFWLAPLALSSLTVAGCFLWNQKVTTIDSDSPLALHCSKTTWCDRRNQECHAPTTDRPNGYCVYVGESDRAYGAKRDGGTEDGGTK